MFPVFLGKKKSENVATLGQFPGMGKNYFLILGDFPQSFEMFVIQQTFEKCLPRAGHSQGFKDK